MKRISILAIAMCVSFTIVAQTDTTLQPAPSDTIAVGKMIIIKKRSQQDGDANRDNGTTTQRRHHRVPNLETNWGIVDLGFSNFKDKTDYNAVSTQQFAPGATKDWFKLRNGKSINVNVWVFMQRIGVIKNIVNLKYGLGVELNNYMFEEDLRFRENPTVVYMDNIHYSKIKLAADYVTVPLMLNLNFTPHNEGMKAFGVSAGISAGYLYSSRQKFVSSETGKKKVKDDFDMRPFRISYIGELQLGPVKFYASLATESMFQKGLDQTPYNFGVRLSNW